MKKTESLKEMKSTLKAVEMEWRMLFNEELANLELDLCVRSRRVEWRSCGGTLRLRLLVWGADCSGAATEDGVIVSFAATRRHLQSWE